MAPVFHLICLGCSLHIKRIYILFTMCMFMKYIMVIHEGKNRLFVEREMILI